MSRLRSTLAVGAALIFTLFAAGHVLADTTILNVSYDPTRELYKAIQRGLRRGLEGEDRRDRHHRAVAWRLGHAGARGDRRARRRRRDAGARRPTSTRSPRTAARCQADWRDAAARQSARPTPRPSSSWSARAIPRASRTGAIWSSPASQVITPNPKTSGGARWNYLAAWACADKDFGGDEAKAKDFVADLYPHVPVLDTGARGSTTTFAQRGIGDVLLAWENEAFLALQRARRRQVRDRRPAASRSWPSRRSRWSTAMSTPRARARSPRPISKFLYTPEAQKIIAKNFYRPAKPEAADPEGPRALPEAEAGHHRRSAVRRLGEGAAEALRRRRHLRPDLQAASRRTERRTWPQASALG